MTNIDSLATSAEQALDHADRLEQALARYSKKHPRRLALQDAYWRTVAVAARRAQVFVSARSTSWSSEVGLS